MKSTNQTNENHNKIIIYLDKYTIHLIHVSKPSKCVVEDQKPPNTLHSFMLDSSFSFVNRWLIRSSCGYQPFRNYHFYFYGSPGDLSWSVKLFLLHPMRNIDTYIQFHTSIFYEVNRFNRNFLGNTEQPFVATAQDKWHK